MYAESVSHERQQKVSSLRLCEGDYGMVWENSTETNALPGVKQITSACLLYDGGHPNPVLCDNQEGQGGEGDGRGVQEGEEKAYQWPIHTDIW